MRALYEGAIKEFLNNDFEGAGGDALPFSINLAIDRLMQVDGVKASGVESVDGGMSFDVSYWDNDIRRLILPYKKAKLE